MFRATHTPPLSVLLDDLLTKTLKRWMPPTRHHGPRCWRCFMSLAGGSLLETTAHNGYMVGLQHWKNLERENAMLRTRIARLEAIGDFGAANAPAMGYRGI